MPSAAILLGGMAGDENAPLAAAADQPPPPRGRNTDRDDRNRERRPRIKIKKEWDVLLATLFMTVHSIWLVRNIFPNEFMPAIFTEADIFRAVCEYLGIFLIGNDELDNLPMIWVLVFTLMQLTMSWFLLTGLQKKSFRKLDQWMIFTMLMAALYSLKVWHSWDNYIDSTESAILLTTKVLSFYTFNALYLWRTYECKDKIWRKARPTELQAQLKSCCCCGIKRALDCVVLIYLLVLIIFLWVAVQVERMTDENSDADRTSTLRYLLLGAISIVASVLVMFGNSQDRKDFLEGWICYNLIFAGLIYVDLVMAITTSYKVFSADELLKLFYLAWPWLLMIWLSVARLEEITIGLPRSNAGRVISTVRYDTANVNVTISSS